MPAALRTAERSNRDDAEVLKYIPLVHRIVRNVTARMPTHTDRESLVGAGMVGLLCAFEKFDPDKGVVFEAYARIRIRGAIQDELRTMDHLTRGQRKSARQLSDAREQLVRDGGQAVSDEELASASALSVEEVQQSALLRAPPQSVDPMDLDNQLLNGTWQDRENQEEAALKKQQLSLIKQALGKLPDRDQAIMGMYYQDELTLAEIGSILKVSQSRVSQLIGRVKRRLRAELYTD